MASPPISQGPSATVPALQSPDQLYGFLSEICESLLLGRVESDPKRRMESFFNISQALVDNFLASFPSPNDMLPWSTLQETRRITTISMRLIQQISGRTEDSQIFSGPGLLGRNVFFRFFSLSSLFDSWVDLQVPPEEGYDSPEELQAKARQTCIAVLRALGNSGKLGPDSETIAGWGELRTILDGCLSLCEG